jgi:hypothetical protein
MAINSLKELTFLNEIKSVGRKISKNGTNADSLIPNISLTIIVMQKYTCNKITTIDQV